MGVSLLALPQQREANVQQAALSFEHLSTLLASLTAEEALSLSGEQALNRLFHADECRLYETQTVEFGCECSEQRSLAALRALGPDELLDLIEENRRDELATVSVDCHFCFQRYEFKKADLQALLSEL